MSRRFQYNGRIGPSGSRGVVLFVALVFLILLTLLALSSSTNSLLQEKMVGSTRNAQMANFGAESALRDAEASIWDSGASGTKIFACDTSGSGVCYKFDPQAPNSKVIDFQTKKGWVTNGAQTFARTDMTASGLDSARLAHNPVYIIEDLGVERPPGVGLLHESGPAGGGVTGFESHIYRITARSAGGSDKTIRVLQSTFAAKAD
ncbi:MAG: pilus assembly protein [Rhodanobacteraceae bacterium]